MSEGSAVVHEPAGIPLSLVAVWMVLYLKATGEITQVMMQSPDTIESLDTPETGVCEIDGPGIDPLAAFRFAGLHYVDASGLYPRISARTACPATLEGHVLRNLPVPCTIEIGTPGDAARFYPVSDSDSVEIEFEHPGEYGLTVRSACHTPGEYQIVVEGSTDG